VKRAAAAGLLMLAGCSVLGGGPLAGTARAEFVFALYEPAMTDPTYARMDDLGVRRARVILNWSSVAPGGASRPAVFDAPNPADPRYRWASFDAIVRRAMAGDIELVVTVMGAPAWAQGNGPRPQGTPTGGAGGFNVNAAAYAEFATAVATRYSGRFADPLAAGAMLPRVRFWQAWNEPNLPEFLYPTTVRHYRPLLNGFYDAVKAVNHSNVVIAAGLAPVASQGADYPLRFTADLLCLRHKGLFSSEHFLPGRCHRPPARFDVLSIHPYSLTALPGQPAAIDGNVFVANVPTLAKLLRVATRARLTVTRRPRMWVTEFAWFTDPPNKSGVGDRPSKAGVYTSEALFRLWAAGVQCVTWSGLTDSSAWFIPGGGLFYENGVAKPTYRAFRMPLFIRATKMRAAKARTIVWGRAPVAGSPVQLRSTRRGGFSRRIRSNRDGVFVLRLRRQLHGSFVARQGAVSSLTARVQH
jgi:hypothetical protein